MTEIIILGSVKTPMIDYTGVPMAYWPKATHTPDGRWAGWNEQLSAVCHNLKECEDLVHWFGNRPDFCPTKAILLLIPGKPTVVAGLGYATAAELRDCCIETWGIKTGADADKRFNIDDMREREGLPRREDVPAMVQEAFRDRVHRHKASPITDPFRQFKYPNPTHKQLFKAPDSQDWKGES